MKRGGGTGKKLEYEKTGIFKNTVYFLERILTKKFLETFTTKTFFEKFTTKKFLEKFTTKNFPKKLRPKIFLKKIMTKHFLEKITTFQNFSEFRYSEIFSFHPEMKKGGQVKFFSICTNP